MIGLVATVEAETDTTIVAEEVMATVAGMVTEAGLVVGSIVAVEAGSMTLLVSGRG